MNYIGFVACGADPEVFFRTRKDGSPMSAEGLVGGTKRHPLPIPNLPFGFFVQEDNVAAEYNIPPATTANSFSINIAKGLKYLRSVAAKKNLVLAIEPDMDFPMEMLMTPHAQQLGCDPDFNAWTGLPNKAPVAPPAMRSAAGHVHVSWENPEEDQQENLIKVFDAVLGLPSILITPRSRRRMLYGKAGAMRYKPYGVEYRVLDNFWIKEKVYRKYIFDTIQTTIHDINEHPILMDAVEEVGYEIQQAINTHDVELTKELMAHLNINPFPELKNVDSE
jgi:hypothetical protein